nr:hypothetical protein [uncultured Pseudomonas sp.]
MRLVNLPKLVFYFFKGLERNFKIIRYGDVPKIYESSMYLEKYAFADGRVLSYFSIVKELLRHLLRPVQKIYKIPNSDVLFCGGSSNNEKEFIFFSGLLSGNFPVASYSREKNLSFVLAHEKKKTLGELALAVLIFFLCGCYFFRIKMGPMSFKYLVVYSKIYLQVFCSFQRARQIPKLMVVANDHTDFPVAASMIMKYFGVQVAYVQHAEISEAFPPLDFDISILRNQKSLDKYRAIGCVSGDTFIIPRAEKHAAFKKITQGVRSPPQVILYLSSVFDPDAVRDCIELLSKNPGVAAVGIKHHPRASMSMLQECSGITIYEQVPQFSHIAIVPNSSVAIELLEQGVAVFQYFALDSIDADYYGLVEDSVTLAIARQDLLQSFWNTDFYDAAWLCRFTSYSPAVDESWRELVPTLTARVQAVLGQISR